ncbi:MAG: hypothetical protein QM770_15625 [Tepidisphaeraceae bacterium]
MHFQREVDVVLLERIQDRAEALGEIVEAFLPVLLIGGREGVDAVPDRRAGEAVHDGGEADLVRAGVAEQAGGLRGVDHLLRCAFADAFGIAIAPDVGRQDALVTLVDVVADRLPDEVRADRDAGQAVVLEQFPLLLAVRLVLEGGVDVEVVAPAGEFQAVVAEGLGFLGERFERQVGPLAGEERDEACHVDSENRE